MIKVLKWLVVGVVSLCATIGGVFASWTYPDKSPDPQLSNMAVALSEFEFAPEEILPDDDVADQAGENHLTLIDNIVNHITYGLNATKKPIIKNLLLDGDKAVYSHQKVQGGNLKHLLLDGPTVNRLDFVVEYVSDTEFMCYTFQSALLISGNVGKPILVYKTKIILEYSRWRATVSYEGQAPVAYVNRSFYSIDYTKWVKK